MILGSVLGKGGFAKVYQAEQSYQGKNGIHINRQCAVKVSFSTFHERNVILSTYQLDCAKSPCDSTGSDKTRKK